MRLLQHQHALPQQEPCSEPAVCSACKHPSGLSGDTRYAQQRAREAVARHAAAACTTVRLPSGGVFDLMMAAAGGSRLADWTAQEDKAGLPRQEPYCGND